MIFYILQIMISIAACFYYQNNRLRFFSVITVAYFLTYYSSGSFDVSLTLYCFFIIIGSGKKKEFKLEEILFGIWLLLYFAVGIIFQNAFSTVAALVTRYGFIIVYIFVCTTKSNNEEWNASTSDFRFAVQLGIITEYIIVALVWLDQGMGARVVINNQPIGAGMVIALSGIIGWCYLTKQFSVVETIFYVLMSILLVFLSGTRGYMIIITLSMIVILGMVLLDVPQNGKKILMRIGCFCIIIGVLCIPLFISGYGGQLIQLLRLDVGLGYRENENYFVKEIMKIAPWYNQLLGFGLGGTANHIEGFLTVVQNASWNRDWMFHKLMDKSIFHNYWYTVLFKQGLLGLILILIYFFKMIKNVIDLHVDKWFRFLLIMMILGNMVAQTYRITATCSVYEIVIISFFIKMFEQKNNLWKEG